MLVPRRVKYRRQFRGKMRGEAKGGKEVHLGNTDFKHLIQNGLQVVKLKQHVSQ